MREKDIHACRSLLRPLSEELPACCFQVLSILPHILPAGSHITAGIFPVRPACSMVAFLNPTSVSQRVTSLTLSRLKK